LQSIEKYAPRIKFSISLMKVTGEVMFSGVGQESSAKLTNQRVSYAFISSPLSFHARHILPTSKFPA